MTRYNRVPTSFWVLARDWEERVRNLALYLLTCDHRTGEGLYRLPLAYVAADMGWSLQTIERQMANLVTTGFVVYDRDAEVVLIPGALELQAPTTKHQITGAVKRLKAVPPTALLAEFYSHANAHSNGLAEAMRVDMAMELQRALEWDDRSHSNGTRMDRDFHSSSRTLAHAHTQPPRA